ncbi:MAG: hypothetical protein AAF467_25475, partial [Actinomycetota bacterium]
MGIWILPLAVAVVIAAALALGSGSSSPAPTAVPGTSGAAQPPTTVPPDANGQSPPTTGFAQRIPILPEEPFDYTQPWPAWFDEPGPFTVPIADLDS